MRKLFILLTIIFFSAQYNLLSEEVKQPSIYLLTCGPGTETYSVYGHSAIRIVNPADSSDKVFNWGVFDFSTPHFAWRFAKGRLDYMLGVYPYERFLQEYIMEQRWVISQRINLEPDEINRLLVLINENLKPENIRYRYDFFYDDCSTRIRDLIEKAIGEKLVYPPVEPEKGLPTFREKTAEFQRGYDWMKYGVDLIMGSPGDKKANFRDRMFLPVDLKNGLSELVVNRSSRMMPLLQAPVTVVDFESPIVKANTFTSPLFVFSLLLIIVIIMTATIRKRVANNILDLFIFAVFSILAVLMIFFNFFTDHQQMRWNLNIIWLSPFIILCLISLVTGKYWQKWFRITFYLALLFLVSIVILPQEINKANVPLIIILIMRSSVRSGFKWNPLTLPDLT